MEKIKIDSQLRESIANLINIRTEITKRFQDNNEPSSALLEEEGVRAEKEENLLKEWFKDFYMIKVVLPEHFRNFENKWSFEKGKETRVSECNVKVQLQFPSMNDAYTINLLINIEAVDFGVPDKYEFKFGESNCFVVERNKHLIDYFRSYESPNQLDGKRLEIMLMDHSKNSEPVEFLEKSLGLILNFYKSNLSGLGICIEKNLYVDVEEKGNFFNVVTSATKDFISELIKGIKTNKAPNIKDLKTNTGEPVEDIWSLISQNLEKNRLKHKLEDSLIQNIDNKAKKNLKI